MQRILTKVQRGLKSCENVQKIARVVCTDMGIVRGFSTMYNYLPQCPSIKLYEVHSSLIIVRSSKCTLKVFLIKNYCIDLLHNV